MLVNIKKQSLHSMRRKEEKRRRKKKKKRLKFSSKQQRKQKKKKKNYTPKTLPEGSGTSCTNLVAPQGERLKGDVVPGDVDRAIETHRRR
jgi:hypothetical protein